MLRREFVGRTLLGGALAAGLLDSEAPRGPSAAEVLQDALDLGRRLRRSEITPLQWQAAIGPTLNGCSIEELCAAIDLPRLRRQAPRAHRGASMVRVPLLRSLVAVEGAAMRVFFFEPGRSDPPHCHFNQVTAHLVLEGRFRVRHFERLGEDARGFFLRASHDRVIGSGQSTSISDLRDNAHWHSAITRGVLMDIEQGRLDPSMPVRRRQMVDPRGPALADGSIFAPRLSDREALARFG